MPEPFFLAHAFPDILDDEQVFLTEHLNKIRRSHNLPLTRRFQPELSLTSCALLVAYRKSKHEPDPRRLSSALEHQVEYAPRKWGLGIPYYDGEWEDVAVDYGLLRIENDGTYEEVNHHRSIP